MSIFNSLKTRLLAFMGLFIVVFICVSTVRQCNESTQTVGTHIASIAPMAIKQNAEIVALNQRIETLENLIDSLNTKLQKIDSLRYENFANTPHSSVRKSYRDITKRYTK